MIKQSRSKEQSLGKLMKIYVSQMLLNAGVQSCQEQGLNLLSEFLVKLLRKIGSYSRRVYELQGRQEGDIFHLLLALDRFNMTPTKLLTYFGKNNVTDHQLNMLISNLMEQIFKERYGPEDDEIYNLRRRQSLPMVLLLPPKYNKDEKYKSMDDLLAQTYYFKNQTIVKEKKQITEKEMKDKKRQQQYQFDEDQHEKQKQQQKSIKYEHQEYELNPFNIPLKKLQTVKCLEL